MGYLHGHPVFQHLVLLQRADSLWLVLDADGRWTLPGFVSEEQHTAEVELVSRHVRAHHGLRISILGTVSSDFDEAANRVRKVYLAEALSEAAGAGRWWPRSALTAGEAPLGHEAQTWVTRWLAGSLGAADAPWSRPGWVAEALAWVATKAGQISHVEQVRVSEFSTVIRIVAGGRLRYFKAVAPAAAREPPVTAALARRTPHVPRVLATHAAQRFLLLEAFAGEPLATDDVAVWTGVARALGELQRDCIDAVGELRAMGCAVTRATTLVEPLPALLADADALLVGEPSGLTAEEVAMLRTLAPGLAADARALDAGPLPLTVDHGDLWPSNVLVGPGGCAFVDWEDARIAHPFVSPFQLLAGAHMDHRFADEAAAYTTVREAYLAGWSGRAPGPSLRKAFDVAHDVAAIAVAESYRRYAPEVVAAHPWMREMPPFCLRRILARRAWAETPAR